MINTKKSKKDSPNILSNICLFNNFFNIPLEK